METNRSLVLRGLLPAAALALFASTSLSSSSGSCPSPVNYCFTSPNSVGSGAVISWTGTPSPAMDDFHLVATGLPGNQFLLFCYGGAQIQNPFGNGWRCVGNGGGGLFRFSPVPTDGGGTAVMKVDYTRRPAGDGPGRWLPGDTWYCQGWYRDPAGGGAQFNLTDGLEVQVCPDGGPYDGMALVPAGTFEMGDHSGPGPGNAFPVHPVYLDAFYMDVFEVTNQKYADYLNTAYAQGRITVSFGVVRQVGGAGSELSDLHGSGFSFITWNGSSFGVWAGKEDHPVHGVSWFGACAFANQCSRDRGLTPCYDEANWTCDFTADGYRLPTEAEWEYAARGGEHNPYYLYPWGDTIDGSNANFLGSGDPFDMDHPGTTPVGYYDGNQTPPGVDMANGYGLYDMTGNLWEWCWDWYDFDYYSYSPPSNPTGPASGSDRVRRGGCWEDYPAGIRSARRHYFDPVYRYDDLGFRVVAGRP